MPLFNTSYKLGKLGELVTILYLKLKLYKIISTRMRNFAGEIDIVAFKNNTLIFIEVKTRKTVTNIADLITYNQRRRITRAANVFLANNPKFSNCNIRFDFIVCSFRNWPIHIKNAWED